jgi:hypothetical protein
VKFTINEFSITGKKIKKYEIETSEKIDELVDSIRSFFLSYKKN